MIEDFVESQATVIEGAFVLVAGVSDAAAVAPLAADLLVLPLGHTLLRNHVACDSAYRQILDVDLQPESMLQVDLLVLDY